MSPKKQGNLFSFFKKNAPTTASSSNVSKRPPTQKATTTTTPAPTATTPAALAVTTTPTPPSSFLAEKLRVGDRVSVLWPDDDEYYDARITARRGDTTTFDLLYDDDETETIDLAKEQFKKLDDGGPALKRKRRVVESDGEEENDDADVRDKRPRRTVEESDDDDGDEEFELHVEESDDDEDEQLLMVTEDESSAGSSEKAKRCGGSNNTGNKKTTTVKRLKVSKVEPDRATLTPPDLSIFSSQRAPTTTTTSSLFVSPPSTKRAVSVTPASPPLDHRDDDAVVAPKWTNGAVNPMGSHIHNHLPFLVKPRDSKQRPRDHPDHDPRTLYVDHTQLERVIGKKPTPAQKQWWDIKSRYFDTVLLFKTGKFYEMFHTDADVGVKELNFKYMKGAEAHAGFPEGAYGVMSARLVEKGYKVARVEQTETPAALAARKKTCKTGKKPQVVNREVCSVLTKGTRTFCHLDDARLLDRRSRDGHDHSVGAPLLAVREVVSGDAVEYGVAVVDAVRSVITLGQFADDALRSRLRTLLSAFAPGEVLVHDGASRPLTATLRSLTDCRLETVRETERFPASTAIDPAIRRRIERPSLEARPWDPEETVRELDRKRYFPRASKGDRAEARHGRWPVVLRACVDGKADLALAALGSALFYLQRSMIDEEILTMGDFRAYVPPSSPAVDAAEEDDENDSSSTAAEKERTLSSLVRDSFVRESGVDAAVSDATHMRLDGTTLANLEILTNQHDGTPQGSLWARRLDRTVTAPGSRLLRAWLLRPLFRKVDIDRRADAVEELVNDAERRTEEARGILKQCGDTERLLSRVHTMGLGSGDDEGDHHPNERAVLYEGPRYTRRKVEDFSKLLHSLKRAGEAVDVFKDADVRSPLLRKIVRCETEGGCFPSSLEEELRWFFDHFDCEKAARGDFEPVRGVDPEYDEACEAVVQLERDLQDYKTDMCRNVIGCGESAWKYINTKVDSRDKYLVELSVSVKVPQDFYIKGKRGSGAKQVNKYRTSVIEDLVETLESALAQKTERRAQGMRAMFAKFDSRRSVWAAASQATAMLDALGSLAELSSLPGFVRPEILDAAEPRIEIVQGRHPCVDTTHSGGDFIPNDLTLGDNGERVLLLSGPNMGGKSTLLRQTCLIAVLAQIGSYVPAVKCALTPVDRIFTRLGASDRILSGQSTFFVELAETAAALRGATARSLVIMDELGRGTSTFDGTAIAHATVRHLVERNGCLALFATHYHSLLSDWKDRSCVRLGHMECLVEKEKEEDRSVTFLYTLGEGACPKSFGINVARLAALPDEVLTMAKLRSSNFESELNGDARRNNDDDDDDELRNKVKSALERGDLEEVEKLWDGLA